MVLDFRLRVARVATVILCSVALLLTAKAGSPASADNLQLGDDAGSPIIVNSAILFHTLASDFSLRTDGTIYVGTGDIPAMWLRDAAAQMLPYVRFAAVRPALMTWIRAVIEREARNIIVDPYANAFTAQYRVWERKWEVDSLSYPMMLAWAYYASTHDRRIFSARLHRAMKLIVSTYACEQHHRECSRYSYPGVTPGDDPDTGLLWTAFRPSDDPATYHYNIPQQMMALTALGDLGTLASAGFHDEALASQAATIAVGVQAGIDRYASVDDFRFGWIYAYEADGLDHTLMMDDADVPNLLSAPLFGYVRSDDPQYLATRSFILSAADPSYCRGTLASGLGSPHTPQNWVWPLGIIEQALTARSDAETRAALLTLTQTDSEDGLIHESFDPDDARKYTRNEFGWGNAMYAELLFRSAAGFSAPPVRPNVGPTLQPPAPRTPFVVGPLLRAQNIADLIASFERAVPLPALRTDTPDDN